MRPLSYFSTMLSAFFFLRPIVVISFGGSIHGASEDTSRSLLSSGLAACMNMYGHLHLFADNTGCLASVSSPGARPSVVYGCATTIALIRHRCVRKLESTKDPSNKSQFGTRCGFKAQGSIQPHALLLCSPRRTIDSTLFWIAIYYRASSWKLGLDSRYAWKLLQGGPKGQHRRR